MWLPCNTIQDCICCLATFLYWAYLWSFSDLIANRMHGWHADLCQWNLKHFVIFALLTRANLDLSVRRGRTLMLKCCLPRQKGIRLLFSPSVAILGGSSHCTFSDSVWIHLIGFPLHWQRHLFCGQCSNCKASQDRKEHEQHFTCTAGIMVVKVCLCCHKFSSAMPGLNNKISLQFHFLNS